MSGARIQLEPGYILSAQPYRDSSLLVEAFTRSYGRVGLVARGARGPRSKTRVLLQALRPLLLSWSGGGDLATVSAVEAAGAAPPLAGERVFYGWYLNELLLRLLQRHDPHVVLFDAYTLALARLAGDEAQAALRLFEKCLLEELGYGLHLPDDLDATARYRYDWALGPVPAGAGEGGYRGASLLALAREALVDIETLTDARRLLREALSRQLGGRVLDTPRLLRELRAGLVRPGQRNNEEDEHG